MCYTIGVFGGSVTVVGQRIRRSKSGFDSCLFRHNINKTIYFKYRGQGIFRARLESIEAGCRVTGVLNPKHLIASHIKPWSKSKNQERLDGNNGLLLSPHIDHLFDKGHITFSDTGDLLISVSADKDALKKWQVSGMNVGGFNQAQLMYLQYHREHVFNQ